MNKVGIVGVILLVLTLIVSPFSCKQVDTGYVSVTTLFGKPTGAIAGPGMHFPVNPLLGWTDFDTRQKSHKESIGVPSRDQLVTTVDVSVQWRINGDQTVKVLENVGADPETVTNVHMIPKIRSIVREAGKSITRAEDFFLEETQRRLQQELTIGLSQYLSEKGIIVDDVLIRDVDLPKFIQAAIEGKKVREQEAEKQKAELARYETEQQQKIVEAEAGKEAAKLDAEKQKVAADARAYEIEALQKAIAQNPAYLQLEALKTLQAISKDPAAKLYFLDGKSANPLPLMHLQADK